MIVEHLPKTGCQTDLGEAQQYIVNYSDTYTSLFLRVSCAYEFMLTRTRAPKCHFYISDFSDVSTKNFFLHSMKVSRGVKKVLFEFTVVKSNSFNCNYGHNTLVIYMYHQCKWLTLMLNLRLSLIKT